MLALEMQAARQKVSRPRKGMDRLGAVVARWLADRRKKRRNK